MEDNTARAQRLAQKYPPKERNKYLVTIMAFRFIQMGLANGGFSLLLSAMVMDLGFDAVQRGGMVSANSTGQLIATLFIGFVLDRVNAKKVTGLVLMVVAAATCVLRGFMLDYTGWLIIMFLWGFAYSSMLVATMKIIGIWFPADRAHEANGYFTLSGPLGQLVGMTVTLNIVAALGSWKTFFIICGVVMIVICVIFMIICKNRPAEDSEIPPNYDKKDTSLVKDILALIKIPRLWFLWLADAAQASMITLSTTYGQIVLQNDPKWGLDAGTARRVSQMVMIGAVIGYFVIPRLSKLITKKGGKDPLIAISIFACACGWGTAIIYSVGYNSYNFNLVLVLMLIGGIGQGGYVCSPRPMQLLIPEVAGGRAGSCGAFSNIIGRLGLVIVSAMMSSLAVTMNDSALMMIPLYGVLAMGPVCLIIFVVLHKRYLKKTAAAKA